MKYVHAKNKRRKKVRCIKLEQMSYMCNSTLPMYDGSDLTVIVKKYFHISPKNSKKNLTNVADQLPD